jgi:hypothetical protein
MPRLEQTESPHPPAQPVPPAAVASPAPPEKQPFAVFSPLDSADAKTAAIVREALRDEPTAVFRSASAAASPERSSAAKVAVALAAVAAVGAAGWFAWREWGPGAAKAPASAPAPAVPAAEPEPAPPLPEPLSATPGTDTTLAEAVGVDPNARSAAADPPAAGTVAPQVEPGEARVDEPAPPAAGSAATSASGAEAADAAPASVVHETPAAGSARALRALELRETATGVELVLAADAGFAPGSYSYSEIGGENPRVLIKLRGMESPYRGAPAGANRTVRGVRTGFHLTAKGNEIHVVVDLARPAAKVAALEPVGSGLVLRLSAP